MSEDGPQPLSPRSSQLSRPAGPAEANPGSLHAKHSVTVHAMPQLLNNPTSLGCLSLWRYIVEHHEFCMQKMSLLSAFKENSKHFQTDLTRREGLAFSNYTEDHISLHHNVHDSEWFYFTRNWWVTRKFVESQSVCQCSQIPIQILNSA